MTVEPIAPDELLCVLVQFANGEQVWIPIAEYQQNPAAGSFIVRDQRRRAATRP